MGEKTAHMMLLIDVLRGFHLKFAIDYTADIISDTNQELETKVTYWIGKDHMDWFERFLHLESQQNWQY